MKLKSFALLVLALFILEGCETKSSSDRMQGVIEDAAKQYTLLIKEIEKSDRILIPHTVDKQGDIVCVRYENWASGFFPGSLWQLYALTGDKKWKSSATTYMKAFSSVWEKGDWYDIGFIADCSFLNAMRCDNADYCSDLLSAARSFATCFRPEVGVLQSWSVEAGQQFARDWQCPVGIESLVTLELLFEATRISNDSTYYYMAVSHADRTLEHHYRVDNSCFHIVDYDSKSGEVRSRLNHQGYSDESAWARGQAWGLYGYTICYRYTHNLVYLEQASKIYDFIFTHPNLPIDLIPYWDYNALNIPNELRDVSSAAITASALYELSTYLPDVKYRKTADRLLECLSSSVYRAEIGTNGYFILKHSVGNFLERIEVDVPLDYADYYYLEALARARSMNLGID